MSVVDAHRLLQVVARVAPGEPPLAAGTTATAADALCADCLTLFPWAALTLTADAHGLVCTACQAQRAAQQRRARWTGLWRQPVSYVVLAVLLAATLYAGGVGRPTLAGLAAHDQGRPWNEQQLAHEYLRQAQRTVLRVQNLATLHRPAAEAEPWAALAAQSLATLTQLWDHTEVTSELRLATALMQARSSPTGAAPALATIQALAPQFEGTDARALGYRLERAKLALQAGQTAVAHADLNAVLTGVGTVTGPASAEGMLDQALTMQTKGTKESVMHDRVAALCGTGRPLADLRREATELLTAHHLAPAHVASDDDVPAATQPFGLPTLPAHGLLIEHDPE